MWSESWGWDGRAGLSADHQVPGRGNDGVEACGSSRFLPRLLSFLLFHVSWANFTPPPQQPNFLIGNVRGSVRGP